MALRSRYLAILALSVVVGWAPAADASGRHHEKRKTTRPGAPGSFAKSYKVDDEVNQRMKGNAQGTSSVIVTLAPGAQLPSHFQRFVKGPRLDIINSQVLELPNGLLKQLSREPSVLQIHDNRATDTLNYRTAITVGARLVQDFYGYTGSGVGIAVLDSGISTFHDDLTAGYSSPLFPYGNQRVRKFVDFVNGRTLPYDDNGHGTHVAGTIAGNGFDSSGTKAGMAPKASIISLKVLDANGQGTIGHIISALSWVAANATAYNIRVVNLSVGAPIRESYWTDPLTLATKALTDRGIVVVAAAGNQGRNAQGQKQWGGITAPANAPWVLTVGASSTEGTLTRSDDVMAPFSSHGPTYLDWASKPDLVAPGTGTVSLAVPGSLFYSTKATALVAGSLLSGTKPYLALSGTSMAAPVVSGTVALMLQANPSLTPNLVKAILQYTAQVYRGYKVLEEGAGFLNTYGAVKLARFYATSHPGDRLNGTSTWSHQIIWGNHRLTKGFMSPTANAWANGVVWGSAKTLIDIGDNIVWGTLDLGDNIVWGTLDLGDNIVWGTLDLGDNIVWGTNDDGDNIVWGTDCGGGDCANTIWGTLDLGDNIVWGTLDLGDNIVWGTSGDLGDNIVWGTSDGAEATQVFPDADPTEPVPSVTSEFGETISPTGSSPLR